MLLQHPEGRSTDCQDNTIAVKNYEENAWRCLFWFLVFFLELIEMEILNAISGVVARRDPF